jgi:hypothetical protein
MSENDYKLTKEQISFFHENGYLHLKKYGKKLVQWMQYL